MVGDLPKSGAALSRSAEDALLGLVTESNTQPTLLVCSLYENQRPLKGVAGLLDWRLRGFLSRFVISGRILGKRNEFVYIPIKHHGNIRHLLMVGLGEQDANTNETQQDELLAKLAETVTKLKFKRVAISCSSFPFFKESRVKKAFKAIEAEFI